MSLKRIILISVVLMSQKSLCLDRNSMLWDKYFDGWPEYVMEACCNSCEAINDIERYNTQYLRVFKRLVIGRENWLFRSEVELKEDFSIRQDVLELIQKISSRLNNRGVNLVLIRPPTRGMVHIDKLSGPMNFNLNRAIESYRSMIQQFDSAGVLAVDLSGVVGHSKSNHFYFKRDHHWTPEGAKLTALIVSDAILSQLSDTAFSPSFYKTEKSGSIKLVGTLERAWNQLCQGRFLKQVVYEYETKKLSENSSDNDLFSDVEMPDITLVGTSYSKGAVNYNFSGYLQEFLQTEVLNVAVPGGSYQSSVLEYFPSEDFQVFTPKLVLWEVPAYHNLNKPIFFRQFLAAIENGCQQGQIMLEQSQEIDGQENDIMLNVGSSMTDIRGKDRIIDVTFSGDKIHKATFEVWYTNGSRDRFSISQPEVTKNNNRLFFYLKEKDGWDQFNFLALKVIDKEGEHTGRKVDARLCFRSENR